MTTVTKIVELLEKLLGKIIEIYDVGLTEIYEDLTSHITELRNSSEDESKRYWDLVRKLAVCEKERYEERRAKEWAIERAKVWEGMFEKADELRHKAGKERE